MKRIKMIFLTVLVLMLTLTLASCKQKTERNTVVPYGDLNLSSVIAQSTDKNIDLTLETYYSRLRAKGYDLAIEKIKTVLYQNEIAAITNLIHADSVTALSSQDRKTLSYEPDTEIDSVRFEELKKIYTEEISVSLANSIYSTSNADTFASKTEEEKALGITKYIESMARKGYTISAGQISPKIENDTLLLDLNLIPSDILFSIVLGKAEDFYAQKQLYAIADKEYLNEGTDEEEKNSNYLFKTTSLESSYNSSYKTFGTYKAIIITFNSRREAMQTMEILNGADITDENALESYLKLYNSYYSYRKEGNTDITADSDLFLYEVSLEKNELDDISSSISTLITETLENGQFLTEPRNLNNKYVLAYRIETVYDLTGTDKQKDFEDIQPTDDVMRKLKNNIIRANSSAYLTTAFKELLENSDIEIYDPVFEYRFRSNYTDEYDLIEKDNANIGKNLILKVNDTEYTVSEFYNTASSRLGASIITEYFQQEYAYLYADEFVTEETTESNTSDLDSAIKTFEKNQNSTYPKEIGLETYLMVSYGYPTKADVLKYYYTAASALTSYKAKVLFSEWATEDTELSTEDKTVYKISDEAKKVLERILKAGNDSYSSLFSLNVDHILINIDYDADGTPDDPAKFISEYPEMETEFKNAVQSLAQAIYREAICEKYSDNSLYETLTYIVKQYNKGAKLLSNENENWDMYKSKFHFMLTAEQLASSADITQETVSNFVEPFADYLKDMYKKAADGEVKLDDNGNFFTVQDGKLTENDDYSKITVDTLCETVYGYHLIVLNEYDGPDSLKFTVDNDPNKYQQSMDILVYEDEDDEDNNIYVTLSSYNEETSSANLNQLFIYYVQTKNGEDSSLDSNIATMMSTLFSDAINIYSSTNFQTMVLLDELNITSSDDKINTLLQTERNYYANLVIDYDSDSAYATWINPATDWSRPNQK